MTDNPWSDLPEITVENFSAAMETAVEMRGSDYVYPTEDPAWWTGDTPDCGVSCVYSLKSGEPACIIGQALYNIHPDLVPDWDESCGLAQGASAEDVLYRRGVRDQRLLNAALVAQNMQDSGLDWGSALSRFHWALES